MGNFDHSPAPPFNVDIERVVYDAKSMFNPLHRETMLDFQVAGVKDGKVYLSLVMPEGMTRAFVSMLESLSCFFRSMSIKARSAASEAKCFEPSKIQERKQRKADFESEVCTLFDSFIGQGQTVNDAVKHTNSTLKASGHPWATYELVRSTLRTSGRFRAKKGVRSCVK